MLHTFQRLLNACFLLLALSIVFGWVSDARADVHTFSNDAEAHAQQYCAAYIAYRNSIGSPRGCTVSHTAVLPGNGNSFYANNCTTAAGGFATCSVPGHTLQTHYYTTVSPTCEAEVDDQITAYWGSLHGTTEAPASVCQDQCNYNYVSGPSTGCQELISDPSQWECGSTYSHDGADCEEDTAETSGIAPGDPNYYDCTNVDCSSDPDPGGGSGSEGSGPDVPDQNNPNNPPTPDDGDPDTPGGPGSGYGGGGDIDGDGDRDIDCDPQSNPDCAYTGSGQGSGNCDVQPSCSGDPVACAILYQEWASMCYDGAEFTNPSDCQVELSCDGDVLLCEMIRQERQQYCDAYVGDGSYDLDPTNNADFNRDLKDEADVVQLPSAFDTAGLGGGSCPADIPLNLSFGSVNLSFATACSMAPIIRLFVILSATLAAVFIVIGGGRDKGVM